MRLAPGAEPIPALPNMLDRMYEAHHAMVFRTAYRIAGNAADAEDVLQTVFLRLLRRDAAAEIDNPESYLRRSAVNAALDVVRARRAHNTLELERLPASGSCMELRDLRDTLRRALAQLPGRTAEMFALRFFEGYTFQEIASKLGMSLTTTHRRAGLVMNALREKLSPLLDVERSRPGAAP